VILFLCLAASAAAVYYVFNMPRMVRAGEEKTRSSFLRERKEMVYENLRDLDFDFKAGKLPVKDYEAMKNSLEEEAASILADLAGLESQRSPAPRTEKQF
jgi:hypothetical protein